MQNAGQNTPYRGTYLGERLSAGLFKSLCANPRNLRQGELGGRECTKCNTFKGADLFNLRVDTRTDGTRALHPHCKPCTAAIARALYEKNIVQRGATGKAYRLANADRYKAYESRPERHTRRVSVTRVETCTTCGTVGGHEMFLAGSSWSKVCKACRKLKASADTVARNKQRAADILARKAEADQGEKICASCGIAGKQKDFYTSGKLSPDCRPCRRVGRKKAIAEGHKRRLVAETLPESKLCTQCAQTKPAAAFRVTSTKHKEKTLSPSCVDCQLARGAEYRAAKSPDQKRAENQAVVALRRVAQAPVRAAKAAARALAKAAIANRTEKACTTCNAVRNLDMFTRSAKMLDGKGSVCKPCQAEEASRRRALDPDGYLQKMRERNSTPAGRARARARTATRTAQLSHPEWSEPAEIRAVFAEADRLTKETGTPWAVDHIWPLQSDLVCGLHVACNLRAVPRRLNAKKINKLPGFLAHELWDPTASNVFHESSPHA